MKPVVLIGPPGSGKSTVGLALSERLALKFIDTDQLIEISQGKSVSDIFIEDGEESFREIEFAIVSEVLNQKDVVISCGGGAPISERAQTLLSTSDICIIFLDISLAVAAPRIGFNRDRPLLLGNPRAQWQALSDQRRPIYERLSDFTVKVDALSTKQIVDEIEGMIL